MQNSTLVYGIGAVIVVALGIGAWMYMGNTTPANETEDAESEEVMGESTTLRSLYASATPQRCTFSVVDGQSSSEGVVYVANGRMRGDFTSVSEGQTIASYMIVENNTSYVWSDAMPYGVEMSFDAVAQSDASSQTVNPDVEMEYDCDPWTVDAGVFALPSGIEFQDMSAMMQGAMQGGMGGGVQGSAGMQASQCGACDQAPNESARAQCRAALQCQ